MGDLFKKKKKESEDLYVNPKDLIVNMIKTRTKLQNVQNDKFHRLSLSAFVLKEAEKAARGWSGKERKKEEQPEEEQEAKQNWGF